jgi:biopolymer transport protein ExbD
MPARAAEPVPMFDLNTTPLIDVMLVLLVMLIITIPPQSHAVKLDLPVGIAVPAPDPVKNMLVVTEAGALAWNGVGVSKLQLRALLAATAAMEPAPELHLQPDAGARYELVDEVLAMTKRAGVRSMGFVGNQDYADAF